MLLNIFIWMSHGYLKISMSKGPYDLLPSMLLLLYVLTLMKVSLSTKLCKQETQMLFKITLSPSSHIANTYIMMISEFSISMFPLVYNIQTAVPSAP